MSSKPHNRPWNKLIENPVTHYMYRTLHSLNKQFLHHEHTNPTSGLQSQALLDRFTHCATQAAAVQLSVQGQQFDVIALGSLQGTGGTARWPGANRCGTPQPCSPRPWASAMARA